MRACLEDRAQGGFRRETRGKEVRKVLLVEGVGKRPEAASHIHSSSAFTSVLPQAGKFWHVQFHSYSLREGWLSCTGAQ